MCNFKPCMLDFDVWTEKKDFVDFYPAKNNNKLLFLLGKRKYHYLLPFVLLFSLILAKKSQNSFLITLIFHFRKYLHKNIHQKNPKIPKF